MEQPRGATDCTLCLKPERQYDAHYRYKMPPLQVMVDQRNKQRKTHLPNAQDVAKNLFRPEAWLIKYGCHTKTGPPLLSCASAELSSNHIMQVFCAVALD